MTEPQIYIFLYTTQTGLFLSLFLQERGNLSSRRLVLGIFLDAAPPGVDVLKGVKHLLLEHFVVHYAKHVKNTHKNNVSETN